MYFTYNHLNNHHFSLLNFRYNLHIKGVNFKYFIKYLLNLIHFNLKVQFNL